MNIHLLPKQIKLQTGPGKFIQHPCSFRTKFHSKTMFSFKNRETSFHLVVAYLISSKAFLAFLSSSFIIRSSFTREYFFGSFLIRKMMSSTEILPGRPTSIAFFVCKIRRYMYLNLKEAGWSTNL